MWCNTQVTYSTSPNNARSESELEFNPLNLANVVGASKRFNNPATYDFTLAVYFSFDAGQTWSEAPPLALLQDPDPDKVWSGVSDPVLAWDNAGNCYLAALPFPKASSPFETLGIAIYRSTDGGRTWGNPNFIHPTTSGDDKQWIASDRTAGSPHLGNVYCAWDNGSELAFARTVDSGATWIGPGAQPVGTALAFDSFAPSIAVTRDGHVHVFWIANTVIKYVTSTDGGGSFSAPKVAVTGVTTLSMGLSASNGFPQFPGGKFRVLTIVSAAAGAAKTLVVAWADIREGVSRIYYRRSTDGGNSWLGSAAGDPLLPWYAASAPGQQDFHPQVTSTPDGRIACAFYEFGAKWTSGPLWIDTVIAISSDGGASFGDRETVTNIPWDPTVDAPFSHGDPTTTFIGDYFGIAADAGGFVPFWTDTRTGIQEIFCGRKLNIGPWTGVQFQGQLPGSSTVRWFTFNWPACWHVYWTVVPITPRPGAPQITWTVEIERATSGTVTYWIVVTNLTSNETDIEGRFAIFAAD
jgi:hypothetical protein